MYISEMEHSEVLRLDRARITELGRKLGAVAAEELVVSIMEELAILLSRLRIAVQNKDLDEIIAIARRMGDAGQRIGLYKLARVASDALYVAEQQDSAAIAAVVERLQRLGDQSLLAVWDVTDVSI